MVPGNLYDKFGNRYRIHITQDREGSTIYEVYDEGLQAGELRAHHHSKDEIFLHHIEIRTVKENKSAWFGKVEAPKYQNRGLGTHLLLKFIEDSYQKGYLCITGQVTRADIFRQQHLLPWYRKHGFSTTLVSTPEGNIGATLVYNLTTPTTPTAPT